jgi:protein O-mannosyl-transferase
MLTKENGFTLPARWKFPEAKRYAFTFITLFIVLFLIYSNSFYGEWIFDDFLNITDNPNIQMKSFSVDSIKHCIFALTPDRPSRPLSYFSFGLNYYFGGLDVFSYHVINFIIHYLAAIFLFIFINNTLKLPLLRDKYSNIAYPVALLSTFFWALHPVQATSVTYIVQRMASMAGMFYILSMYLYLKARTAEKTGHTIGFFIGCALAGLASILSKENAAILPVSILIFDLFLIQGVNKDNIKKFLKIAVLPLALILITSLIYVDFSTVFSEFKIRDFTMGERLITEPRVILFYLSLLFYPIYSRLTLLYDIEISRSLIQPWTTMPAILLIALIIGFAFSISKKRPLLSFCIIFYFLDHLIEGSFFNLELIYEHRNYLPAMLLFIPVAEFIIYAIDYFSYKKIIQLIVACVIVIILVGEGDVTYRRNAIIASNYLLWLDNAEKYPNLSRPFTNLGVFYHKHNMKKKALIEYEKALKTNNFGSIYARAIQEYDIGLYYYQEGKLSQALKYLESAYIVLPDPSFAVSIARIKLLNNNISEARRIIKEQIKKRPDNNKLAEMFTLILFKEKNFKEAAFFAKKSLSNNTANTFSFTILAEVSRYNGNLQSAIYFWKLYQQSLPFDPYANLALIELYFQTNNFRLLDEEIAKLYCLKTNQTLISYMNEISRNKNILVYTPDFRVIEDIIKKRRTYL